MAIFYMFHTVLIGRPIDAGRPVHRLTCKVCETIVYVLQSDGAPCDWLGSFSCGVCAGNATQSTGWPRTPTDPIPPESKR